MPEEITMDVSLESAEEATELEEVASEESVQQAVERPVEELLEDLSCASRRRRQDASHELALIAKDTPELLIDHIDEMVDAIARPEAQTRWEVFSALTSLAWSDPDGVAAAFDGAETSLFDEGSAMARLAAFLFLAALGSTSPERSDAAWPLLDEAIQCYHGDPEYRDMLSGLIDMAKGDISKQTKAALIERVSFDAENGVGYIKTFSAQIVAEAKKRKRK